MENKERFSHFHVHDGSENPPRNHLALGDVNINIETKTVTALEKYVK